MAEMECLFTWKLDEIPERISANELLERNQDREDLPHPWTKACKKFFIAYLHYENQNVDEASKLLEECNNFVQTSDDCHLITYKKAFKFIYCASKAFLDSKFSTNIDQKEHKDDILSISNLSEVEKSGIYAIKAAIFSSFLGNGILQALTIAEEALRLNPNEGEWHYLMGDLLNKERHLFCNNLHFPIDKEINHFQTAFKSCESSFKAIVLAQAYLEKARYLIIEGKKAHSNAHWNEITYINNEAQRLINYALENKGECVRTMQRCAYALSRLPPFDENNKKAKDVLKKALKLCPSSASLNRLAGDVCLKYEKNYDEALEHYQLAANKMFLKAELSVFEIKMGYYDYRYLGSKPDPEDFYSRVLNQHKEKYRQCILLTHACEFYIFINKDLFKALHCFYKAIVIDPMYHGLEAYFVRKIKNEISFYEVLSNEARIALEKQLYKDEAEEELLRNVILEVKKYKPELIEKPINYSRTRGKQ